MNDSKIIVSLDIGTTSMKVVVANAAPDQLSIIGVGSVHAQGMDRGVIVDIDKAAQAIQAAVHKAASQSNTEIHDVVVGLPANGLQIFSCQGMIALNDHSKEIDDNDVHQVMAASLTQTLPAEQEYIALIPNSFTVDGFKNIKDPRKMLGTRLEFNGILYSLPKSIIHNCLMAVRRAGLNVTNEIIAPSAIGQVALDKGERNFGSILIDLGGGQTTAAVIHDNKLKFATVDPEGGNLVTHDISVVLNTTLDSAAKLQRYYGQANSASASDSEEFPVKVVGQEELQNISAKYLAEIIEARLQQIFERLRKPLTMVKALNLPGGVVLSGGLAEITGIETLAQNILGVKVKTFVPDQMGLRHPAFAEGLGLVSYSQSLTEIDVIAHDVIMQRGPKIQPRKQRPAMTSSPEVNPAQTKARSLEPKTEKTSTGERFKNFWKKFFD